MLSFHLFDFNAHNTLKSSFRVTQTATLIRKDNICSLVHADKLGEPLLHFSLEGTLYAGLPTVETTGISERLWEVVRNQPSKELIPGDVLKLGRVIIRVRAVSVTGEDTAALSCLKAPMVMLPYQPCQDEPPVVCRICLSEEQSDDNLLISPCDCSGTVKYIHVVCLQEWLRTRLDSDNTGTIRTYHWKNIDCELCKTALPMVLLLGGYPKALVEINKPGIPFIILEEACRRERSQIHVISMPIGSKAEIGRNPQCQIVLNDVSVSRNHCALKVAEEGFRVEDQGSKFGTLRKSERCVQIPERSPLWLQVGRTLVSVRQRYPSRLHWLCCCCRPRASQVQPEPSVLRHTLISLVTSNPHTEVTDQPALVEGSLAVYESAGQAPALSSDEERSRLMAP